ncbi:MAG: GMC family oxidoreductase N-terminal domain-containing protein [Burkholderiales bacterium]|nr:GMC family oxidoreductase N-terminal domain-containing protein [Burkholderiales bacterium]
MTDAERRPWDYIIVGSGAGGGTLAARLVEAGMRVFLLEAGGDPRTSAGPSLPDDYDVPAFHSFACENEAMAWNFQVRHYGDETRQLRDPKYNASHQGVLYPRAAGLGGCTAHNAMIFMRPHDSDWNHIAELTGDRSWQAHPMQRYAERVESCHHRPLWRALRHLGINPTGHGWDGWLHTERAIPLEALGDAQMLRLVAQTARTFTGSLAHPLRSALRWLRGKGDPNARPWGGGSFEGLCYTPTSTVQASRFGTRERLLLVAARHPGQLHIELDALATRVLLGPDGRAEGVEFLKGARLYRAHSQASSSPGRRQQVRAAREVVLCGGAFNTPQLLMLSGIGPADELKTHGIPLQVDLPGVGRNLQDRYEVAITHRMAKPWQMLAGARFARGDPQWQEWHTQRSGMYATNGAAVGLVRRSSSNQPEPDIFCMALPARFEGYAPGFSQLIRQHSDRLTWAVLKAHTLNRAGRISLRSADPRDTPQVNFHYFEEGSDTQGSDLQAVVQAIRFVRGLTAPLLARGLIAEECLPGPQVQTDAALADYVRNTAWGHHASCSCPIGAAKDGGVLDSRFRVHGTQGLRVVDASVFPRIPGFFIASAVYMVGEKAADVILQDAAQAPT